MIQPYCLQVVSSAEPTLPVDIRNLSILKSEWFEQYKKHNINEFHQVYIS